MCKISMAVIDATRLTFSIPIIAALQLLQESD